MNKRQELKIAEFFGVDMPDGSKRIDGVILTDGTRLKTENVPPAMWAELGLVQMDGKPIGGLTQ